MMISTRGRYALRVMIELAEHSNGEYIPMNEIAKRQNISLKYLEKILPALVKSKLIQGVHGKGGGYRLTKQPQEYRIGEILQLTEGDLAPVACLECNASTCERAQECKTLPMWKEFYGLVNNYFNGITLAELMK